MKNIISYLLILIGGFFAIYANATEKQNVVLLVLGLIALMIGIYILNKKLPSKSIKSYDMKNFEEEE